MWIREIPAIYRTTVAAAFAFGAAFAAHRAFARRVSSALSTPARPGRPRSDCLCTCRCTRLPRVTCSPCYVSPARSVRSLRPACHLAPAINTAPERFVSSGMRCSSATHPGWRPTRRRRCHIALAAAVSCSFSRWWQFAAPSTRCQQPSFAR